ncbi:MAG: Uncharacterised protein [Opitutia bacterium UBA7350]|nr:MAG: Uncharacterised protein [Opitutae bacterium UBA7350]
MLNKICIYWVQNINRIPKTLLKSINSLRAALHHKQASQQEFMLGAVCYFSP